MSKWNKKEKLDALGGGPDWGARRKTEKAGSALDRSQAKWINEQLKNLRPIKVGASREEAPVEAQRDKGVKRVERRGQSSWSKRSGIDTSKLPNPLTAPDLDHLRRENAIPATPPKPNAEPRGDESLTAKQWRQQEDRDDIENQERDEADHRFRENVPSGGGGGGGVGQKRVPAGQATGGRWTR